jgi:hypothetical protein
LKAYEFYTDLHLLLINFKEPYDAMAVEYLHQTLRDLKSLRKWLMWQIWSSRVRNASLKFKDNCQWILV